MWDRLASRSNTADGPKMTEWRRRRGKAVHLRVWKRLLQQVDSAQSMHETNVNHPTNDSNCGLYVHLPFCETKCGYCDFYSVPTHGRDTAPLVFAIVRELKRRTDHIEQRILTIFCGGGTPTILPIDQLDAVLTPLGGLAKRHDSIEFTVEANPATVDDEKTRLMVSAGVGRVSMGAQSFFPSELAALERLHDPDDIPVSFATLRRNGVERINLDLIFGIPGQTLETWSQSLRRAVDLSPDHLACYGLTYEPATRLTAQRNLGKITPCGENLEAEMFELTTETLEAAGFKQYEISNYALPGCECAHNVGYWRNQPYVAVGPSAVGCIHGERYKNIADIGGYIRMIDERGDAVVERETLTGEMLVLEMVMMQMRLVEGLSISAFRARIGIDPRALFQCSIERLAELGKIQVSDTHIALTQSGRLVADRVMTQLVGEPATGPISLPVLSG